MGESSRKLVAFIVFICLCGLTAILFNNPYVCAGITTPILSVAESKAAENACFYEAMAFCGLFVLLLFLSKLFRNIVAIILIAIGINKVLDWIFKPRGN